LKIKSEISGGRQHDFHGRDPAGSRFPGYQTLRDERADIERQIHEQLLAPLLRKEID